MTATTSKANYLDKLVQQSYCIGIATIILLVCQDDPTESRLALIAALR